MDTLKLLGVALGLASLAGLNLYLTVFVTGLAIHQHWVVLTPQFQGLSILGHPAVIAVAGILYVIEFFADKIPWVDSIWDFIHTAVRPVGGALLALHAVGTTHPALDVIFVLLGGGAALTMHGLKAGTRLSANASPEPFSNIALSVGEDAAVVGGLALIYYNPLIALAVLLVFFAGVIYFGPKIFRAFKVRIWLIWRKLTAPSSDQGSGELTATLSREHDAIFTRYNLLGEKIEWAAAPCISASSRGIVGNFFGCLVATVEEPRKLCFIAKSGWKKITETLELAGCTVSHESKFLSENLVIHDDPAKKPAFIFLFDRSKRALVKNIADSLQKRLGSPAPDTSPSPPSEDNFQKLKLPENLEAN